MTDANVILGIIDPDYYLGGRIRLDRAAAERAVGTVADALGIDLFEAAYTIHTTSNHHMIAAIEDITVNEGINPRESYLVAGGGATACHVGEMVRELGIRSFMIPKLTAGLSALGGLISEIKWEETATLHTDAARFAGEAVNALLERLRESGNDFLARAGVPAERRRFEYAFMGRYQYQSWEIEVPFAVGDAGIEESDIETLVEGFHQTHERVYTIRIDEDLVEFTTWKVRAIGERWEGDGVSKGAVPAQDGPLPQKSTRQIYIRELGRARRASGLRRRRTRVRGRDRGAGGHRRGNHDRAPAARHDRDHRRAGQLPGGVLARHCRPDKARLSAHVTSGSSSPALRAGRSCCLG